MTWSPYGASVALTSRPVLLLIFAAMAPARDNDPMSPVRLEEARYETSEQGVIRHVDNTRGYHNSGAPSLTDWTREVRP